MINISDLPIVEIGGNKYRKTTVGEYILIADRAPRSDCFDVFPLLKFFIGTELAYINWLSARVVGHTTEYYYGHPDGYSVRVMPDMPVYIEEPPTSAPKLPQDNKEIRSHLDGPAPKFLAFEEAANMTALDAVSLQKNAAQSLRAYSALKKELDREVDRCIILQAQIEGLTHELTELRAKDAEADDYLNRVLSYVANESVLYVCGGDVWVHPLDSGRHPTKEAAVESYLNFVRRAMQKR